MREILFRGKRIDNGEWTTGDLIQLDFQTRIADQNLWASELINNQLTLDCYDIIPETVGQFTGLTDKNGVKIFEGDIIKTNSPRTSVTLIVTFENGAFCLRIKPLKRFKDAVTFRDSLSQGIDNCIRPIYEVIGNIHDNPKLLN